MVDSFLLSRPTTFMFCHVHARHYKPYASNWATLIKTWSFDVLCTYGAHLKKKPCRHWSFHCLFPRSTQLSCQHCTLRTRRPRLLGCRTKGSRRMAAMICTRRLMPQINFIHNDKITCRPPVRNTLDCARQSISKQHLSRVGPLGTSSFPGFSSCTAPSDLKQYNRALHEVLQLSKGRWTPAWRTLRLDTTLASNEALDRLRWVWNNTLRSVALLKWNISSWSGDYRRNLDSSSDGRRQRKRRSNPVIQSSDPIQRSNPAIQSGDPSGRSKRVIQVGNESHSGFDFYNKRSIGPSPLLCDWWQWDATQQVFQRVRGGCLLYYRAVNHYFPVPVLLPVYFHVGFLWGYFVLRCSLLHTYGRFNRRMLPFYSGYCISFES